MLLAEEFSALSKGPSFPRGLLFIGLARTTGVHMGLSAPKRV